MVTPVSNPHKKGEHVFNDISGSLKNALTSVLLSERVKAVALTQRFGPLGLPDLVQTNLLLLNLERDPILNQARTISAPASGLDNDVNSRTYSQARLKVESAVGDVIFQTAVLIWKKRPTKDSSYHQFDAIATGMKNIATLKLDANRALDQLVEAAHDPAAEVSALSERVSDFELLRRHQIIAELKRHRPLLKQVGQTVLKTFFSETEALLELRIEA